jgi:hypothetical protein
MISTEVSSLAAHNKSVKHLLHNVQLIVVVLGDLGQFRCDVESLILNESQARHVRGLELLREKILHDEHIV